MSITKDAKDKLIKEFGIHEGDKGSTCIQIAVLTKRINNLSEHFKTHKKDNHGRRGLLNLVSRRRKLILYLKSKSHDKYLEILAKLNLRGVK